MYEKHGKQALGGHTSGSYWKEMEFSLIKKLNLQFSSLTPYYDYKMCRSSYNLTQDAIHSSEAEPASSNTNASHKKQKRRKMTIRRRRQKKRSTQRNKCNTRLHRLGTVS